ncbi:hypothetical protein GCM10010149_61220 [Nonomuraea roseoviolacea subsp. roseoviolacea]
MSEAVAELLVAGDSPVGPHECEFDRVDEVRPAEKRDLGNLADVYDALHLPQGMDAPRPARAAPFPSCRRSIATLYPGRGASPPRTPRIS